MFSTTLFLLALALMPRTAYFSSQIDWTDKGADLFVVVDERGIMQCSIDGYAAHNGTEFLCSLIKDIFQLRQYAFTIHVVSVYEAQIVVNSSDTAPDQAYQRCKDVIKPRLQTFPWYNTTHKEDAKWIHDFSYGKEPHDRSKFMNSTLALKKNISPRPDVVIWIDYCYEVQRSPSVTDFTIKGGADIALAMCGFDRYPEFEKKTVAWLRSPHRVDYQYELRYQQVNDTLLHALHETLNMCSMKYTEYETTTPCHFNAVKQCGQYNVYTPPDSIKFCWSGNSSWMACSTVEECSDTCEGEVDREVIACDEKCTGYRSRPMKAKTDPFFEHCPWTETDAVPPATSTSRKTTKRGPAAVSPTPDSMPLWLIITISAGGFLLLLAVIITVACVCVKTKRKRKRGRQASRNGGRHVAARAPRRRQKSTRMSSISQSNMSAAPSTYSQVTGTSRAQSFSQGPSQLSRVTSRTQSVTQGPSQLSNMSAAGGPRSQMTGTTSRAQYYSQGQPSNMSAAPSTYSQAGMSSRAQSVSQAPSQLPLDSRKPVDRRPAARPGPGHRRR